MTTAHKPTFKPCVGGSNQGGNKLYIPTKQFSSRDLPGHLKIKVRRQGQGTYKDIRTRDFKNDLLIRESKTNRININLVDYEGVENYNDQSDKLFNLDDTISINASMKDIPSDLYELENPKKKKKIDEENNSEIKSKANEEIRFPQDIDDSFSDEKSEDDNQDEGDSEMEELMKEFEKIKKMREDEKKIKEKDDNEKLKQMTEEQILMGNPLLNSSSYSLKKK